MALKLVFMVSGTGEVCS